MSEIAILLWALAVVATVLVLYIRDPYARGIHPARIEPLAKSLRQRLRRFRHRLCDNGLCLACPSA